MKARTSAAAIFAAAFSFVGLFSGAKTPGVTLGVTLAPRSAEAAIVERVVAIVGERPVLLSELRRRAKPFLLRIAASTPNVAQQAAAESEALREVLNRMIDERLEDVAAEKAHLGVSSEDVDNAIRNVAGNAHLTVPQLLSEAAKQGLSEQDYRDEIRRQVLEGKLIQLRVRGRVRVTEQDARAAYDHWLKETGGQALAEVRVLAMRIQPGWTEAILNARMALAADLAQRARGGEDFCGLVRDFSDDTQTKNSCGSRGPQPLGSVVPALADLVRTMHAGEIGGPVRIENEAIVLVQLATEPKLPGFDEVKDVMTDRAFGEAMERQRRMWLQEIRRGVYIDVRL